MYKIILTIVAGYFILIQSRAQQVETKIYPELGKPCPDFLLKDIKHYSLRNASQKDFRGKWLILDIWSKRCASCIASFPRMNALQKALGDRVQVMLLGVADKDMNLIYEKYRKKDSLLLPCTFDSVLVNQFDIKSAPFIIVLDGEGIVRGITTHIYKEDMQAFLEGRNPILEPAYRGNEEVPVTRITNVVYNNQFVSGEKNNKEGDSDLLMNSSIISWNPKQYGQRIPADIPDEDVASGRFLVLGAELHRLYNFAYFGSSSWTSLDSALYEQYYPQLILEVKDSSVFQYSFKWNDCKHIYGYSITMPAAVCSRENIQQAMQQDLQRYFGYKVTIETRKCPCWKVIANPEAHRKLSSKDKGMMQHWEGDPKVGYSVRNTPFKDVFDFIKVYNIGQIFVDETGLTGRLDIKMECDGCVLFNSVDGVRRALQRNGLDLVAGEKEMKVLVVRDK